MIIGNVFLFFFFATKKKTNTNNEEKINVKTTMIIVCMVESGYFGWLNCVRVCLGSCGVTEKVCGRRMMRLGSFLCIVMSGGLYPF